MKRFLLLPLLMLMGGCGGKEADLTRPSVSKLNAAAVTGQILDDRLLLPPFYRGDPTGDGFTGFDDVMAIYQRPGELNLYAADINCDGLVNDADGLSLLIYGAFIKNPDGNWCPFAEEVPCGNYELPLGANASDIVKRMKQAE